MSTLSGGPDGSFGGVVAGAGLPQAHSNPTTERTSNGRYILLVLIEMFIFLSVAKSSLRLNPQHHVIYPHPYKDNGDYYADYPFSTGNGIKPGGNSSYAGGQKRAKYQDR